MLAVKLGVGYVNVPTLFVSRLKSFVVSASVLLKTFDVVPSKSVHAVVAVALAASHFKLIDLLEIVRDETAGSPMNPEVCWMP